MPENPADGLQIAGLEVGWHGPAGDAITVAPWGFFQLLGDFEKCGSTFQNTAGQTSDFFLSCVWSLRDKVASGPPFQGGTSACPATWGIYVQLCREAA